MNALVHQSGRVMRLDIEERKKDILVWIDNREPKAFMCKQLKCKQSTLNSHLKRMGIEYEGNMGSAGRKKPIGYVTSAEYITRPHPHAHKLKKKLLHEGVKEHKCEICGITEWNGVPCPLELDHIDGNRYNNVMENIRIICPNCHAQQDTNSGKNKGKYSLT